MGSVDCCYIDKDMYRPDTAVFNFFFFDRSYLERQLCYPIWKKKKTQLLHVCKKLRWVLVVYQEVMCDVSIFVCAWALNNYYA